MVPVQVVRRVAIAPVIIPDAILWAVMATLRMMINNGRLHPEYPFDIPNIVDRMTFRLLYLLYQASMRAHEALVGAVGRSLAA